MYTILEKRQLSADVFYFKVEAPDIARNRKAGQFVLVQLDIEYGERVPLTIADANAEEGWIALVFQAVGATTLKLSRKNQGDKLGAVLGPLGNPTHIEKKRHSCLCWWWYWCCSTSSNRTSSQSCWKQSYCNYGC